MTTKGRRSEVVRTPEFKDVFAAAQPVEALVDIYVTAT